MSDLLPVPGRPDLQWRTSYFGAGRTLSIDLWATADTLGRADATSFAPGVRLLPVQRPVAHLSIPRHVRCPGDDPVSPRDQIPIDRWLPQALLWQVMPRLTPRLRALLGPVAVRAGAPCRLRINHGMATLEIETPEGWRQDAGPLGWMAWTLCDLLRIRDGHRWCRQGSILRHGPVFVPFSPGDDAPLRAWIVSARGVSAWRLEHLAKILDAPAAPMPRSPDPEKDSDRTPWIADLGDGWTLEIHERPHTTADAILLHDAQGYGQDGTRLGPIRGPWPVARLPIEKGRPASPAQIRAEALAMARAVLFANGTPQIAAIERLLPAGAVIARTAYVSLLPGDWRHGTPDPDLPPAIHAIAAAALETRYGKPGPAATPGFTTSGFHDGLAHPVSWSGPWRARGGTAHERVEAARGTPALLDALA